MKCFRGLVVLLLAASLTPGAAAEDPPIANPDLLWDLLEDPSKSRRAMLAALDAAGLRRGPEVDMLRRMAEEDEAHAVPPEPLEELPVAERLTEWIWRLRDETGSGMGANGGYSFFSPSGLGSRATTSDRIASLGHAAVPLLLERLGDKRYTRLVLRWGRMRTAPRVLRIGEAAKEIIERIADRPIPSKNACGIWWRDVQAKGEFMATADEMDRSKGPTRYYRAYLGGRLLRMNPAAAAPLVVRACRREQDVLIRKAQLDLLADAAGEGIEPFLRSELVSGPTLLHRVAAAVSLRGRGFKGAEASLHAAWRQLKDHGRPHPSTPEQWCRDGGIASLAVLLASTGEEGVKTLLESLQERPARVRGLVAQVLGQDGVEFHLYGYVGKLWLRTKPLAPAAQAEAALQAMLGDLAAIESSYTPRHAEARVTDVAAHVLARRFPKRYSFHIAASRADRDAAIAAMRR